jgi:NADH:ubiquinone oxidoreductase subunit 4 (subunit M)
MSGFVSEFMIFVGSFGSFEHKWIVGAAVLMSCSARPTCCAWSSESFLVRSTRMGGLTEINLRET